MLLILSITLLCCYSIVHDIFGSFRAHRRSNAMDHELRLLPGKKAWEAEQVFGPPTEIVDGTSGRQLYIWKALDLPHIPKGDRLLVITLTINVDGTVTDTHYQQR